MFDIGFSELVLCFVIALIVLGPERLPKVARTVGRLTGQARGYLRNLTAELDREARMSDLKRQLDEANKLIRDQTQTIQTAVDKTASEVGKDLPPKT